MNRDCWYLYTLNPYASPAGHSLSALLAGASDRADDGFGASDGEEGTDGSDAGSSSDGAESSDDSLDMPSSLPMTVAGLNKRNLRFPVKVVGSSRGGAQPGVAQLYNEPDQTLEIMMSELDPEVMKIFTKKHTETAAEATEVTQRHLVSCG